MASCCWQASRATRWINSSGTSSPANSSSMSSSLYIASDSSIFSRPSRAQSCRSAGIGLPANGLAIVAVVVQGLHGHQVDDARELVAGADGILHQDRVVAQLLVHLLDHAERLGSRAVHLVDEGQPRHVVAVHLAVDRQRLGLHAAHRAEHQHGPVQHAEATFHLDRKIHVARRVDQVDRVVVPLDLWWRRW